MTKQTLPQKRPARVDNVKSQTSSEEVEVPVIEDSVFETVEETVPEEVNKPLNRKIREKLEELEGRGISVVYPTNESNWDDALLTRLGKL